MQPNIDQYHQSVIDNAREAARVQAGRPLAIALDTKGPEIRTGNTTDDKDFPIAAGTELNITTDDAYATASDDKNMYVFRWFRLHWLLGGRGVCRPVEDL